MRIVIDTNHLNTPQLLDYLSQSDDNAAVITDYAAMESFKFYSLENIIRSWEVLKRFPDQIIILKGNRGSSLVDCNENPIANELIDRVQTRDVKKFSDILSQAASGNRSLSEQLAQRGQWADNHVALIHSNSHEMNIDIAAFSQVFTAVELGRMRRGERWRQETAERFFELVIDLTKRSFDNHPDRLQPPVDGNLADHFLFRFNTAHCVYLMELVKRGSRQRNANDVQNDVVDVAFATYATYFDGLMTSDVLTRRIHDRARFLLLQQEAQIPKQLM